MDEADAANACTQLFLDAALSNHKNSRQGCRLTVCMDCGIDIEPERLNLPNVKRCRECQQEHEWLTRMKAHGHT